MPVRPPSFSRLTLITGVGSALAARAILTAAWLVHAAVHGAAVNHEVGDEALTTRLAAETLLSTLKDAETGQRGYLLTDDFAYLVPYYGARARLQNDFATLEAAPLRDDLRTRGIAELRDLSAAKLTVIGETIDLWQSGQHQAAIDLVRTNRGEQIMTAIRAGVAKLQADVDARVERARNQAASPFVWFEVAGLAALGAVLLGSVILVQSRANRIVTGGFARLRASTLALEVARVAQGQATALLTTILETAPGMIYAKNRDGAMLLANAAVLGLIRKPWSDVEGRTDREFLADPIQGEAVMANDRRIMESGETEEVEEVVGDTDRNARVWLSTKTPLRGPTGEVIGLVGVSVEITERKRVEDRLRLMVNELNHRVKNTLATVQSIARHTLRGADPAIRMKLEDRLLALAAAHDVLTQEKWEGAGLIDVLHRALAPHGGVEGGRFSIRGPAIRLSPRAAVALSLGVHELAVNAIKHGALSVASGSVAITWAITPGDNPDFRLLWQETGGPRVILPAIRGFGSSLIERSLAADLGGPAVIRFEPAGIVCEIVAPLEEIEAAVGIRALLEVGII